jgi:hypothetical protein
MKSSKLLVTRVKLQEYLKAIMMAVTMRDVNWRNIASFSDMPICRVLDVVVMVLAVWPGGRVSRTAIG